MTAYYNSQHLQGAYLQGKQVNINLTKYQPTDSSKNK